MTGNTRAMVIVTKSCPTLCNPVDCSPPGSSVHGISEARILGWDVISFSKGSSQSRDQTHVSCIAGRFFTIWTTRKAIIGNTSCSKGGIEVGPHGTTWTDHLWSRPEAASLRAMEGLSEGSVEAPTWMQYSVRMGATLQDAVTPLS